MQQIEYLTLLFEILHDITGHKVLNAAISLFFVLSAFEVNFFFQRTNKPNERMLRTQS